MSRFRFACLATAAALSLVAGCGERRGQGHVSHELVRAGRARRLLPGQGRGDLREGRPRRDHQDGRPAGERLAAAARRRSRRDDGLRLPGAELDLEGPAGHHHRGVVPEGPSGHHDPRPREGPRRSEGQDHPGRDARPHARGGPGCAASSATPTRRPRPTPSTCSRSSTTRTSCSSPIRRRSRSRRCRRARR